MAPELMRTGKATTCTDVYAFGVFMLEVACGKRPLEQNGLPERGNLVYWVADCWERGSILDASDPQLESVFAEDEMKLVLKLGLFCCFRNPVGRPTMRQVMQYLDGDVVLPDVPSTSNITSLFTAKMKLRTMRSRYHFLHCLEMLLLPPCLPPIQSSLLVVEPSTSYAMDDSSVFVSITCKIGYVCFV
ncbi:receptor like protein kinase S.3-like [Pistacia vera]|uniref:receptor like protein kinase S.3-like n=1 Tax=Pistacia vera TaxID=55513 RepID=UPI001262FAF5|nr:receptor like protein kinase S.3-like [Pistacia vera]